MSLCIWLDRGLSTPCEAAGWRNRLVLWWGRRLAVRHKRVHVPRSCRLSPCASINPRQGAITFGQRCIVAPGAAIQGNVTLGDDCSVQAYSIIVSYGTVDRPSGMIRICNHVRIAPHVMMIASNHVFSNPDQPIHGQGMRNQPITIEDDVWIAGRVNVLAGVTIGRGSVIAAGAVVTKDIPPWSIAVGVPARVIGSRRSERRGAADEPSASSGAVHLPAAPQNVGHFPFPS
jgi:acetyltransferase-like isoleucine patch superfamily enzyme